MMKSVYDWIKRCPLLADRRITIDYLSNHPDSTALENSCDRLLNIYADGSSKRQFEFFISTRSIYGDDIDSAFNTINFLEQISDWIKNSETLPSSDSGIYIHSVSILESGHAYYSDSITSKYQIKVGIVYFLKK